MAQGQLEKAISCFEAALELSPNHFEATYNLGGFHIILRKVK